MKYCNVTSFDIRKVKYVADPIAAKTIIGVVAQYNHLPIRDVIGIGRETDIVEARQIAMYYIKKYNPGMTLKVIGEFFNRDHSMSVFENMKKYDKSYRKKVKDIGERLLTMERITV